MHRSTHRQTTPHQTIVSSVAPHAPLLDLPRYAMNDELVGERTYVPPVAWEDDEEEDDDVIDDDDDDLDLDDEDDDSLFEDDDDEDADDEEIVEDE